MCAKIYAIATPTAPPTFLEGVFGLCWVGTLLGVFYASEKVALAVAIRHKKTPKKGVFIRVLAIIEVYIPANGNYFYLNGSYRAITR